MNTLATATLALDRGFSFLPIRPDGTKAPANTNPTWGEYIQRRPTRVETLEWFTGTDYGMAVIGGRVSGNLEILDFDVDAWEFYYAMGEKMAAAGYRELWHRITDGYKEESPKPGVHVMYRCAEPVEGSRKLAMRFKLDDYGNRIKKGNSFEREVLIETKGEGGYVIVAPSAGRVHPTGRPYTLFSGGLDQVATITPGEREVILRLASEFNQIQDEPAAPVKLNTAYPDSHLKAGDDFNARGDWTHILGSAGWQRLRTHPDGKVEWTRPGSSSRTLHATTGAKGADVFYSFSPNSEFEPNKPLSKFTVYTILNHDGDYTAAAKALAELGYGSQPKGGSVTYTHNPIVDTVSEGVAEDLDLTRFQAHDEGNAEAFMAVYGEDFKYSHALGYLNWTGKQWTRDNADLAFHTQVVEVLVRRGKEAMGRSEAIYKVCVPNSGRVTAAKAMITPKLGAKPEDFDQYPDLLNVANGVVDLRTGELLPHSREYMFTYCLDTRYDPQADAATWLNFLQGAVADPAVMVPYLQKAIGYTLTGHTSEEILFFLYGPPRSGKGTFTESLLHLMGKDLGAEVDFQSFAAKRDGDTSNFDLAPLKAARGVFASESERHDRLNSGKIKALTGGNYVRCCFKHRDHFSYRPGYKIWLSSNWEVNGDADDSALWSRVKVIPFPNSHLGSEDKGFKLRMRTTTKNMEGLLAWAVQGAVAWYALGSAGLSTPEAVTNATERQRNTADFVQEWIEQCVYVEPTSWTANSELWPSYETWCKQNGVPPKSQRGFSMTLQTKGLATGVNKRVGTQIAKGVQGLRLND